MPGKEGVGLGLFTAVRAGKWSDSLVTVLALIMVGVALLGALLSVAGMMLFVSANDLLLLFIALEVLSLPLYVLTGLARRRRLLSQEAALKYFLLGSFSSAFFLFGAVLLYGYAGSMRFGDIAAAITANVGMDGLLVPGILLLAVGLLFKVGAVPFHMWTPDVYQGAPTPVTGFMAACTKVAAFGAMLRVFYVAVEGARLEWQPVIAAVAAVANPLIFKKIIDDGERAFLKKLARLPDGVWRDRTYVECCRPGDRSVHRVMLALKKEKNRLTFENEGTDPQAGAIGRGQRRAAYRRGTETPRSGHRAGLRRLRSAQHWRASDRSSCPS